MTDRISIENWISRYRVAWESNAPDDIRALFTPDGEYLTGPSDEPWRGHDEIVTKWLESADEPGQTSYEVVGVLAVEGDLGVVQLKVDYREGRLYDNIWLIELGDEGRARRFVEWYMKRPESV
jgi:uncharacterized protein (TIGR02246 family)